MTTVSQDLIEVTMPQVGVSVAEGTVIEWKVQVGDQVRLDQTLCEISTDKVDTDLPSPADGTLAAILVEADQTVPVGAVLANIATDNSAAGAVPPLTGPPASEAPAADSAPRPRSYSPVVRRIAETHDLDLECVEGTGRNGRVTKRDVMAYVDERDGEPTAPTNGRTQDSPAALEAPMASPLPRARKTIASRMTHSLATAAHCHSFMEVDMTRVETIRRELGVTALPVVARAAIEALRAHPSLNAWLDGDMRTLHSAVHLGIAVSLGEDGLIVPVIRDAHELSIEGLSTKIKDLAERARAGNLTPEEVQGATFTITNPGGYGTLMSTPIIDQPQVAILGLEAIVKRPVVIDDAIAIRPTTVLGLGWDHRALDGALAAQFLAEVRGILEACA